MGLPQQNDLGASEPGSRNEAWNKQPNMMSDTKQGVCGHWNVSCKVRERLGRAVTRRDCLVWQLQQSDPLNPETDVVALLPSLPLGVCKAD